MRYTGPKCKGCRRFGVSICGREKCALIKRPYPPGVHGPSQTRVKLSAFGTQLREKQKAKRIYGLLERQFSNYVMRASSSKGNTGEMLQQLLETRLDNAIYRLGLVQTRAAARQLVCHGHVRINGHKLDIPSYHVEIDDKMTFDKAAEGLIGKRSEVIAKAMRPAWLDYDAKSMSARVLSKPVSKDTEALFDVTPIIEYYSR